MSPEAMRVAIAEACGWHSICHFDYSGRSYGAWPNHIAAKVKAHDAENSGWRGIKSSKDEYDSFNKSLPANVAYYCPAEFQSKSLPDYPNDLNAMREAEKALTDEQWDNYSDHLLWSSGQAGHSAYSACRIGCNATAPQRAEAFLRTLGKWTD